MRFYVTTRSNYNSKCNFTTSNSVIYRYRRYLSFPSLLWLEIDLRDFNLTIRKHRLISSITSLPKSIYIMNRLFVKSTQSEHISFFHHSSNSDVTVSRHAPDSNAAVNTPLRAITLLLKVPLLHFCAKVHYQSRNRYGVQRREYTGSSEIVKTVFCFLRSSLKQYL